MKNFHYDPHCTRSVSGVHQVSGYITYSGSCRGQCTACGQPLTREVDGHVWTARVYIIEETPEPTR